MHIDKKRKGLMSYLSESILVNVMHVFIDTLEYTIISKLLQQFNSEI